jgi:hypothetical protein
MDMAKYNKLWGALVGGVLGLLVIKFGLPEGLADPVLANSIGTLVGSLFGTFFAPKNTV